jgi:hypothetical protein
MADHEVDRDERLIEHIRRGGRPPVGDRTAKALALVRDDANRHPRPDLPRPFWRWRMSWLLWLRWPRNSIVNLQIDVAAIRDVLLQIPTQLNRMESIMAADRDLLANIAEGLTALAAPVSDLIASEAALRARVADLEGQAAADEAGDLEAASAVKVAFDGIADQFRSEPEVPDVEPLPEVPAEDPPVDPAPAA